MITHHLRHSDLPTPDKMCETCGKKPVRWLFQRDDDDNWIPGSHCSQACGERAFHLKHPDYNRRACAARRARVKADREAQR